MWIERRRGYGYGMDKECDHRDSVTGMFLL